MILQALLVVCLWLVSSSSANYCEVLGLPPDNTQRGNVYFVHYDIPTVELALQCRCTISTPSWVRYNVLNDTFSDDVPKSVECVKNGEDCSPTTHISPSKAAPGYYLYQNYTFKIEQPTVLLCSSTSEKIAVIVRVNVKEDKAINNTTTEVQPCSQTLLPIPSSSSQTTAHVVTSSTSAVQSTTTPPPSPALTVSTTTSTTAADPIMASKTVIRQTTTTDSTIKTASSKSTAVVTPSLVPAVDAGESRGKDGGGSSSELGSSSATFAAILSFTALLLLLNIALILYVIYLRKALYTNKMPSRFRYVSNSGSRRRLTAPESTECSTDDQLSQSSSLRRTSSV